MRHRIFRTAITVALLLQVSALPGQLSTEDHLADRGFWPTQPATSRKDFTGPEACASCHSNKFASAQLTPMKNGAMMAATAEILKSHPHLHFVAKQYQYAIDTGQDASRYTVTDGQRSLSYDLHLGVRHRTRGSIVSVQRRRTVLRGQSDLFREVEKSRLHARPGLCLSPKDLAEAMYRPVPPRRYSAVLAAIQRPPTSEANSMKPI